MKSKVLIGGLIGGVAFFLLGWLIYGILLADYRKENCDQASSRSMEEYVWWALIGSNLVWGYFLALILSWTNTSDMSSGLQKGVVVGLLTALAIDLSLYSMTTMFLSVTSMIVDVAATTIMVAIGGGLIGWYMGMANKEA